MDPILLLGLALLAGAALALAPPATAVAAVLVAIALRSRLRRVTLALAAAALLVSGWRARAALDAAAGRYARTVAVLQPPVRCDARGFVIASPIVLGQALRAPDEPPTSRADVELTEATCGALTLSEPIRARLYGAPVDLARGDGLELVVDLAPVHLFRNEGLRDATAAIARTGITASGAVVDVEVTARGGSLGAAIDRARAWVRGRIDATFHPGATALGRALVLGETDLDPDDEAAFRESGLSHLLAVSGTHLILAVASLAAALRALLVRVEPVAARWDAGRIAAAACIPAAWLYADFAGGGGSALRAAAMLSCAMLARVVGRRSTAIRNFAWSLAGAARADPLVGCDLSFGLSAAATAGLLWLQRPLAALLSPSPAGARDDARPRAARAALSALRKVMTPVATTLAAMLGCAPLLLLSGATFPLLGVAANLIAAPLGELAALPFCLAHAVLWWAPSVERGCALVGSGALLAVRAVARASAQAGGVLHLPEPSAAQLAALAVTVAAAAAAGTRASRRAALAAGAAAWLLLEGVALRAGAPRGVLRINVLDVGQGDATLIDLPEGGAMLIDAGGFIGSPVDTGARVVRPLLRARRRTRLDVVVLSHPHPDHFGGLPATVDGLDIGELWDTGQGEAEGAGPVFAKLLNDIRARGIRVRRPTSLCGRPHVVAGATIEVLAPCPSYHLDHGANDNSLVLRVSYGARAALLVGDAEREAEAALLARYGAGLRADFLKVGHHGSRTSTTPGFLAAVDPSLASISCGVRNRFGHPHPETLATLAARGVAVARTDRGGALVWQTDGTSMAWSRPGTAVRRLAPRR